jgi:hypothetical protein
LQVRPGAYTIGEYLIIALLGRAPALLTNIRLMGKDKYYNLFGPFINYGYINVLLHMHMPLMGAQCGA